MTLGDLEKSRLATINVSVANILKTSAQSNQSPNFSHAQSLFSKQSI